MRPINHLLYMDDLKLYGANKHQLHSLIQAVGIFSEYINISFGIEKCAALEITRGRRVDSSEVDLRYLPYMKSLLGKLQMWLKRSPGDGSRLFF